MSDESTEADDPAMETVRLIAVHAKGLAARIRELEAEVARLTALGGALADALDGDSFADADAALDAWANR